MTANGFVPQELDQSFQPGEHRVQDIPLVGNTDLKGVVLTIGEGGKKQAIPNATLEVRVGQYRGQLVSANNGGFEVGKMPSGPVEVTARAEGFRDARVKATVNPEKPWIEVPMTRTPMVSGVVVDEGNPERPVPNATIQVNADGAERQINSGADGRFVVGPVRSEQLRLTVQAEGYRDEHVSKKVDAAEPSIQVLMKPLINARGVVVDATNRQRPVVGASVKVTAGPMQRQATSGSDGAFAVNQLPTETVRVAAQAEGYRDAQRTVQVDPNVPWIEVQMTPLVAVQGATVEAGSDRKPIANASVRVSVDGMEQRATSANNGAFTLTLPLGEAKVTAEAPGYAETSLRKTLTADDRWIEIPMAVGRNVTGTVVNAVNNQPVSGARVTASANGVDGSDLTDEKGKFEISAIPVGQMKVEVSHREFEPASLEQTDGDNSSLHIVLSPKVPEGEARIVLTWGEQPRDLDGHLFGPDRRFHVCFDNRQAGGAKLDVDTKRGLGPETITVKVQPGTYEYYVVHPGNIGRPEGGQGLAESRARVRVYYSGSHTETPITISGTPGRPMWHAADIVVDEDGRISTTRPELEGDDLQWLEDLLMAPDQL